MNVPHVVHTFICQWTLGLFPTFDQCAQAAMNTGVQIPIWVLASNFFVYILRIGISGSCGKTVFTFLRNHHPVFHNGCTCNVCSYFFTSSPKLVISCGFFFDMATLMSVNVALICISLMISEIEIFLCAHPLFKEYKFTF